MPPPETMYTAEQINIPPELPDILKQYTKAAIRTQPIDLLSWSAAYFTALTNGDPLPVKKRLEAGGLGFSIGLLEILYHQIPGNQRVTIVEITKKWDDLGLPADVLHEIIVAGGFAQELEFSKFFAVAASHLGGGNIADAMKIICTIVSRDPQGGACRIPFEVFKEHYQYLASLSGDISQSQIDDVFRYLEPSVKSQQGMVMPRNFLSPDCPKLS